MYRVLTLVIAFSVLLIVLAVDFGYKNAVADLHIKASRDIQLKVLLIQAILDKQRAVPQILAKDRDIVDILQHRDYGQINKINHKLHELTQTTKATVIYILNQQGTVIAASNYQDEDSFVASNFSYRSYFINALQNNVVEHFALGAVSHKPGLYISRAIVDDNQQNLGVIVSKIEFSQLEQSWNNLHSISFITNLDGIIIISSLDKLRFQSVKRINQNQQQQIMQSLQFGNSDLEYLALNPDKNSLLKLEQRKFIYIKQSISDTNWQLHFLFDVGKNLRKAIILAVGVACLIIVIILGLIGIWWRKQIKSQQLKLQENKYKKILQQQVSLRTSELFHSNLALRQEIEQRAQAEQQLKTLNQELIQANRLAILGQSIAAVAHEVNQPLTAIRSYAENAQTFLQRCGRESSDNLAYDNLQRIVKLTERIYNITDNLRNFARKDHHQIAPVSLNRVINGALMVLSSRIDQANCKIEPDFPPENWLVLASQIRLEQVLINLVQNAIEACSSRPNPKIKIYARQENDCYVIDVQDNGLGISPEIKINLFAPFNTNKDKGLGLGLVISQDIMHSFGGEILCKSDQNGTLFTLHLKIYHEQKQ